jgi:hypothetical protein
MARIRRTRRMIGVLTAALGPGGTSGGATLTVDNIVQKSGSNYTFMARRSTNIANAETRSYALAGSSSYLPAALASDFGGTFPSGSINFLAGSATAAFVVAAVATAQPE